MLRAVRARPRPRLEPRPHADLPRRVSRAVLDPVRAGGVRRLARARPRPARPLRADRARRGPGADLGARARRVRRAVPAARRGTRCARTARSSRTAGRRCFVADAGVVFADRARHAFLEAAGVEVETNRRIESTDELDADVVVVTAGSWIRELVPDVPVTVTRETVAYFRAKARRRRRSSTSTPRPAATGCTRSTIPCTG